jgi:hypothetical protein
MRRFSMLASVWLHLIVFAFVLAQHALHVERLTPTHVDLLAPTPPGHAALAAESARCTVP